MVQPRNNPVIVSDFMKFLGIDENAMVRITVNKDQLSQVSASSLLTFPDVIRVDELFSYWLALLEPPSRYFMQVLSHFVDDQMHKEKL
jgi:sulfite reductase alpha subunit-like flavoprotein